MNRHLNRMALLVSAIVAVVCVLALAGGCNTMEGLGEDISAGGDALSNTASDANPDS